MNFMNDWLSTAFVVAWIVLIAGSYIAGQFMDAVTKKRWLPRLSIVAGILFVAFVAAHSVRGANNWDGLWVLAVVVSGVIVIGYINNRFTKICEHCGTTSYNHNWLTPMTFCSKCGEKYNMQDDVSKE